MRVLLAVLLTLLLPAAAGAATVTRTLEGNVYTGSGCSRYQMCDQRYWLAQLSDTGAEPNDVTVEVVADGLVFRDAATPPAAGGDHSYADGGAGTDVVDYSGASAPVDVDLARGTGNGQAGAAATTGSAPGA